jgi:hypothetical protein
MTRARDSSSRLSASLAVSIPCCRCAPYRRVSLWLVLARSPLKPAAYAGQKIHPSRGKYWRLQCCRRSGPPEVQNAPVDNGTSPQAHFKTAYRKHDASVSPTVAEDYLVVPSDNGIIHSVFRGGFVSDRHLFVRSGAACAVVRGNPR